MRRFTLFLSIVVLLGGLLTLGSTLSTQAQESTPTVEGMEFAPGVVAQALAFAEGQENPSLYRVTFAPGATLMADEGDPSIALASVEAGSLVITIDAPVAVTRGGGARTPEIMEAGTEFTVDAGDYLVIPPLVAGDYRNDGQEEVSVVVASLVPSESGATPMGSPEA